jgi:hypothetical protein
VKYANCPGDAATLEELNVLSIGLGWRLVNSGIECDAKSRGHGGSK